MTAWVRGAVEQPTITGRTRLAPDSIQALFACDDCNFSSGQCRAGPQNFVLSSSLIALQVPRQPANELQPSILQDQGHRADPDVRLQSWSYWSHRFARLTASITLYLLWFLVVDAGQLIARVWMRLE